MKLWSAAVVLAHLTAAFQCCSSEDPNRLGCYDMPIGAQPKDIDGALDVHGCIASCHGHTYAGVKNATACFCLEQIPNSTVSPHLCSIPCPGNGDETCGGMEYLEVFSVCPRGYYFMNDTYPCGSQCHCLHNRICQHSLGLCPDDECAEHWSGFSCNERDCDTDNGGCQQTCGVGYNVDIWCGCYPGYLVDESDRDLCVDVDECALDNGGCAETCVNTDGSYHCTCLQGYEPNGTRGMTCIDIDECKDKVLDNQCMSCMNLPGSFKCSCQEGYTLAPDQSKCINHNQDSRVPVIIIVVLMVSLAVALAVVVVCIIKQRQRHKGATGTGNEEFKMTHAATDMCKAEITDSRETKEVTHATFGISQITDENDDTQQPSHPIHPADFVAYFRNIMAAQPIFQEEFQSIPSTLASSSFAADPAFKSKNRFKNIVPYNHNLVQLHKDSKWSASHYINASLVKGHGNKVLIAAQGPNSKSLNDFWRMIWEYEVEVIVMLTNVMESGKKKCHRYWAESQDLTCFNVTLQSEDVMLDYTIRKLRLEKTKGGIGDRQVMQYHYTSWPDHSVPGHTQAILRFRRVAMQKASSVPIVVHCSAGVGRTGTLLALDYVLHEFEIGNPIDILNSVYKLRTYRMHMVQTLAQYAFVHAAVADFTQSPASSLTATDVIARGIALSNCDKLINEFQILETYYPAVQLDMCLRATDEHNKAKNRSGILPMDKHLVKLMTSSTDDGDYINAVFVPGYRRRNGFISTQWPLVDTMIDLWRMVYDYKLHHVVVLEEGGDSEFPVFLPTSGHPLVLNNLCITTRQHTERKVLQDSVSITKNKPQNDDHTYMNVAEIQSAEIKHNADVWSVRNLENGELDLKTITSLFTEITRTTEHQKKPIAVICRDGTYHCGMFIAMTTLMDMMDTENECDVFYAVQYMKTARPEFIASLDQYRRLYQMMAEYCELHS